ncbi:MAG: porin [Hyphomicrobiales bacterium]|nr:porin [Hyphomicrobiales bacterium]
MRRIAYAGAVGLALGGGALAADLPTKKAPPAPPPATPCFASFWDYLNSTPAQCPLSYLGVTLYGTIDAGVGYSTHGAALNPAYPNGVAELISKASNKSYFQFVPNGLSQSNVGIQLREPFAPGWAIVGDVNAGFDPYSLQFANGPRSLVENNNLPINLQSANGDSSRAGAVDNTRAFLGVSNSTFGALTAGRQYALSTELVNSYDPMAGSYAFSLIGNSSTYVAGTGNTELARYNTSLKYQVTVSNFRAGAAWQFGGYEQGNGSNGAYQFDIGGDYAGFSVDGVYSHATNAVALSAYNGVTTGSVGAIGLPAGVSQDDLKATLANIDAGLIGAKFTYGPFKAFGGYEYSQFSNPSNPYPGGFQTIGDFTVLPGAVTSTAYTNNKILQVAWVGAKYSILSNLDVTGAYYYAWQNTYLAPGASAATACLPNTKVLNGYHLQGAANSYCAGDLQAVSGMIDWRAFKRLDVYAGVMYSAASGGIASGYLNTNNVATTAGLRFTF